MHFFISIMVLVGVASKSSSYLRGQHNFGGTNQRNPYRQVDYSLRKKIKVTDMLKRIALDANSNSRAVQKAKEFQVKLSLREMSARNNMKKFYDGKLKDTHEWQANLQMAKRSAEAAAKKTADNAAIQKLAEQEIASMSSSRALRSLSTQLSSSQKMLLAEAEIQKIHAANKTPSPPSSLMLGILETRKKRPIPQQAQAPKKKKKKNKGKARQKPHGWIVLDGKVVQLQ